MTESVHTFRFGLQFLKLFLFIKLKLALAPILLGGAPYQVRVIYSGIFCQFVFVSMLRKKLFDILNRSG